jgi:hypothetical protein
MAVIVLRDNSAPAFVVLGHIDGQSARADAYTCQGTADNSSHG